MFVTLASTDLRSITHEGSVCHVVDRVTIKPPVTGRRAHRDRFMVLKRGQDVPPLCVTTCATAAETVHRTTWRNVEADANADTDGGEWHVSARDAASRDLLYDLEIYDVAC